MLVLGPLAGVTAAYMNFSLGFFVGGQVLAGLLGSAVTAGYGRSGQHGANYIQTAAASVASMSGMAVLVQAMAWLGLPQPPAWQLVAYFACIGLFGVGVGMLYTPVLVDRLRLAYPSGLAVANILRALTDARLLRHSMTRLGGGAAAGLAVGLAASRFAWLGALEVSASTFGAGLIVGARIGIPAVVGGLIGWALQPSFVAIGWLQAGDPPRKIMFLLALGTIMGAAVVDLALVLRQALAAARAPAPAVQAPDWRRVDQRRLWAWVVAWGAATAATGHWLLQQPLPYLLVAIVLVFLFALVNGIAAGVSDSNPISSAFVVSVVVMAALGLAEPAVGLMAGAILLVSTSVACDMQQDRSTGWRLGTPRVLQFRYQVLGILVGAVLAVAFARLFMAAYPVLLQDQTLMRAGQQPPEWGSAMTYKFVGVLRSLTDDQPHQRRAIAIGIGIGFAIEVARKWLRSRSRYRQALATARGRRLDFVVDAVLLPSPYALSFGGFVNLPTALWLGGGGVVASLLQLRAPRRPDVPADMGGMSLLGGGLIAGDALAALGLGLAGLLATVF
ncbi:MULTISPECIES: OPT/YSL family transporter [Ramlibacter]|uniref:Peptide transporter n=1 Tax=Ramlibacter pinisoli TaxID=2682844 RepID=A0A6N8J0W8_9BURK|nr:MULTISPECIES: OPT/YSL family transporter [Ramlibacter]MBA2962998.1 OPT/YSL family transporter [Ramlibacter sp. CGMCC 1.13660]MVQ32941.1 peptide transporter [Ramlibacter pinisoli]